MPGANADIYDALIIGAGPAGTTAACALASAGRTVCLIDADRFPRKELRTGWLSAKAIPLLADMKVPLKTAVGRQLQSLAFYSADLNKTAYPKFSETPAYLVNRARFDHQLVKAAVKAGAKLLDGRHVDHITLEEWRVSVALPDAHSVSGRLLIMAAGWGTPLMNHIGLPVGARPGGSYAARVQADTPGFKGSPSLSVILGIDQAGGFGTVIAAGGSTSISIHTTAPRTEVIPDLVTLCRLLTRTSIVKADLSREAAAAPVVVTPTAVALAMDTHVAKRTLVVGDAGGFVAAGSGEGIYPAMWSATIAADVIVKALDEGTPQDALIEFDTAWRMTMADHLRTPGTDTQYILPLIFSNQPMADRMGAAFFLGENI